MPSKKSLAHKKELIFSRNQMQFARLSWNVESKFLIYRQVDLYH